MSGDPRPQDRPDVPASTVLLLDLPVKVHVVAAAHQEALQREIDIISIDDQSAAPARLLVLIDEVQERFGGLSEHPAAELQAAIDRGAATVDLTYVVPPDAAEAAERLLQVLDEVDEYCRRGEHLLTLASPPEVVAYRRWFLGEFAAQLRGAAPTPWSPSGPAAGEQVAARGEGDAATVTTEGGEAGEAYTVPEGWSVEERGDQVVVRPTGELDLQTAPEVRDLIQAVRREGVERVELDLSEVSFIDSVGLSMVVSAHQRLAADGVPMTVVIPSVLRRLFEISGLGQLLDLRG